MAGLSGLEKLANLYMSLERLDTELEYQLELERGNNQRYLKPSKTTRYKMSLVRRAISGRERIINHAAEKYQDWLYKDIELKDKISDTEEQKRNAELALGDLMTQLALPTSTMQMDKIRVEITHHGAIVLDCSREIKSLESQLNRHAERRPPAVKAVCREELLEQFGYRIPENELPKALKSIAHIAQDSIDSGEFKFPKNELYPDVSFMFEGREKDESEIEGSIREDSTVASDKDAPDS